MPNQLSHIIVCMVLGQCTLSLTTVDALGATSSVARVSDAAHSGEAGDDVLHTIQLFKQYVPIVKEEKTVAYKTSYFGQLSVGGPKPQLFTAVFDTGSGHVILPSVNCFSETCRKHRRFNHRMSSSAVDVEGNGKPVAWNATTRDQMTVNFGTGKVTGQFVQDDICIGAVGTCFSLRVVMATEMTHDPFGFFDFDGVVGLGLNPLTLNEDFNFFNSMVKQHPNMQPQFSVFLARTEDDISIISFGGYDKERAQSEMTWTPVADPQLGYWQVKIEAIRIGTETLEECGDGTCRAILDSGTSLLGVPRAITKTMHRLLARRVAEDAYSESMDCRTMPGEMVHFDLADGSTVSLDYDDYTRPAPVNITTSDSDTKQPFCRALLLPVDLDAISPKAFIFGEPLLRRYYTAYDMPNQKVGFALAKPRAMRSADKESKPFDSSLIGSMAESVDLTAPVGSLAIGAPLPASNSSGSTTQSVTV